MAKAAKVLVVDDDDAIRDGILTFLSDGGFEVFEASNGEEAILRVAECNPDVVVCDLNMPVMGGLDVLRSFKKRDVAIPVIIISGVGVMADVIETLRLGASDYLKKPIADLEVLEHSIRRCINQYNLVKENQRVREELELANRDLRNSLRTLRSDHQAGRQLQARLLPESPQELHGYTFSHRMFASLYLSGDFVDYMKVGDNQITFFIADVSGHGASSAFVTALIKNFTAHRRSEYVRRGGKSIVRPLAFLKKANEMLLDADLDKHMTMCVGVINIETNELTYSVAGHLPLPVLVTDDDVVFLEGEGMPVGLFEEAHFTSKTLSLPDKFSLYLFSDGILEILPNKNLTAKQQSLLDTLADSDGEIHDVCRRLNISAIEELPDDIAVLTISKG